MTFEKLLASLKPPKAFRERSYPNLRRMAGAELKSSIARNYHFSRKAARAVENDPQVLLHNRIHDREEDVFIVYETSGRAACGIKTETSFACGMENVMEDVVVLAPEEIPDRAVSKRSQITDTYPDPFLPFDLARIKGEKERKLAGAHGGYKSDKFQQAIYQSTCPFDVYAVFHFLTQRTEILSGVERVLEAGSGLSIVSLTLAQFLLRAEIVGLEIDPVLLRQAQKLKDKLHDTYGYPVIKVKSVQGDICSPASVDLGSFDAVIGWFPIGHDLKGDRMIEVLQRMRTGGLFFQLYSGSPFSIHEDSASRGFREIPIDAPFFLPVRVFERIQS